MRESMLHDLYWGKVHPWERERVHNQEDDAMIKRIDGIVSHFKNVLSPEEYARFEEMQDLQAQADIIADVTLFEYGFRLGALMMIDVFGYKEHD